MGFTFMRTEPTLWTTGFYRPDGKWEPDADHGSSDEAAGRTHWLNGGCDAHCEPTPEQHAAAARRLDTVVRGWMEQHADVVDVDFETQSLVGSIIAAGLLKS